LVELFIIYYVTRVRYNRTILLANIFQLQ